jgi:hypothetical protein
MASLQKGTLHKELSEQVQFKTHTMALRMVIAQLFAWVALEIGNAKSSPEINRRVEKTSKELGLAGREGSPTTISTHFYRMTS